MTAITKGYRKKKLIFFFLSVLCWLGLCGILISYGLVTGFTLQKDAESIGSQMVAIFMPMIVTYGIALVLMIFIREKMRSTVWIVNIVMSAALLGTTWMYISLGLFAMDEYLFTPLYRHYKNKQSINIELDKRLK